MSSQDRSPHALLVDEQTFALVVELEIRKAVRLGYPVSVVAVLPDPAGGGEIPDPGSFADQVARAISRVIRGTDLLGLRAASSSVRVLLVGAALEHLHGVIQRITEEVTRYRFRINGDRTAVTLSVGSAGFPATVGTSQDLLSQAETRAREARRAQA
jgi:hypothetical protein